jgi:hypothetical protein
MSADEQKESDVKIRVTIVFGDGSRRDEEFEDLDAAVAFAKRKLGQYPAPGAIEARIEVIEGE